MRLWAWGQSDPGRKRERNEDSYLVDTETGVMAVADGMGGHQGGATASRMAVEFLGRELADARGNFEKALAAQLQASLRTTEEMPAVDPLMDSMNMPTSPRSIAESAAACAVSSSARAARSSRRRGTSPSCAAWAPR